MKKLFLIVFCVAASLLGNAQEKKTVTLPYENGTLSFQYYEKDGVKVPDGPMEFTIGKYSEKGDMKDGYREGHWIVQKSGVVTTTIDYNYKEGMLEGETSIKHISKDKSNLKYYRPDATYNFHKGRLIGENKVVHLKDTIYCNFGEDGKRIGLWKLVNPDTTKIIEWNDDPEKQIAYEIDVLGQKQPIESGRIIAPLLIGLQFFDKIFREIPDELRFNRRPKLPTLCENKYGYVDAWVNDNKDDY